MNAFLNDSTSQHDWFNERYMYRHDNISSSVAIADVI